MKQTKKERKQEDSFIDKSLGRTLRRLTKILRNGHKENE